jgi:serine/threonine protein kinase
MFACLTGAFPFDCSSEEGMPAEIADGLPDVLKQKSLASLSPDGKNLLRGLLLRDVGCRANCEEALAHRWFADCPCNWAEGRYAA